MAVARWTPFQELDALERRMNRFFDEKAFSTVTLPAADVYETDEEYVVELEVPGFAEDELAVQVTDHTLCVKGERTEEKEEAEKADRRRERLERSFERRFILPTEAGLDEVEADFENGILKIHAPKAGLPEPRTIEIGRRPE